MLNEKSLFEATNTYYWKPMAGFFRSIEMGIYEAANINLSGPILDLGCGDGGVLEILTRLHVVHGRTCGLEIDRRELNKARNRGIHDFIINGDVNRLPFPDQEFTSIICNGVLCSVPQGIHHGLSEIHRVLRQNGILVGTVPTDQFVDVLLIPKILRRAHNSLAVRYVRKINQRLPHFTALSIDGWKSAFQSHGLHVEIVVPFFSSRAAAIWNILSVQLFRVFGLLKLRERSLMRTAVGNAQRHFFNAIYQEDPTHTAEAGYIFFACRKQSPITRCTRA